MAKQPTTAQEVNPEEALLMEMVEQAKAAPEPGAVIPGMVLDKGGEDKPPSVVRSIASAGYVFIYDTRTGERSVTNRNMLPTQLKKTREDGSRVFTTIKPDIEPMRGNLKCLLHAEAPDRDHYDELGFAVCRKSNLRNPFQVQQHMKRRHPAEWATIEQERQQREKEEDRAYLKSLAKERR